MLGVLILAGGEGDRIGGNKSFMMLAGRSLISYVLEAVSQVSDETVVVISRGEDVKGLEALLSRDIKFAIDLKRGGGPLIGVYSGLSRLRSEYAMVLPCDSPFINAGVLRYLIGRAEGG